jgi:hypothetical protein
MRVTAIGVLVATLAVTGSCRADTTAAAAGADTTAAAAGAAVATGTDTATTAPAAREVTIPAGTPLTVILDTPVGSDTSRVEGRVTAHLRRPVVVHGETVLAAGSRVGGVVTAATRSGKVKGRAHVAVRFDSLSPQGGDERYSIHTSAVGRTAPGTKKKDALEIGGGAAGGALIGALVGGKKGAAIGAAAGGGGGTAVVLSTRGKEVRLPRGSALTLRLVQPVTIRVRS